MRLTPENIRFIDHYLQRTEVVFVDIRQEMTDHIATAVETKMQSESLDFYEAFKAYMLEHKGEILKSNKQSAGYSFSVLKAFGKFLIRPQMLVFAVLHFVLLTLFLRNGGAQMVQILDDMVPLYAVAGIAVLQLVLFFLVLKKRFYYIEKNSFILVVLYYPSLVFSNRGASGATNLFFVELFLYLMLAYVIYVSWTTYRFVQSNPLRNA